MRIESERITNLGEYEALIVRARAYMVGLKESLNKKDYETSIYWAGKVDLTLHQMEAHDFQIERRTITVNNPDEDQ